MFYILDDAKNVVKVNSLLESMRWQKKQKSFHVADTTIKNIRVSTVFLGIDTALLTPKAKNAPAVFETMVFKENNENETYRYATWEDAEKGHHKIVNKIKKENE